MKILNNVNILKNDFKILKKIELKKQMINLIQEKKLNEINIRKIIEQEKTLGLLIDVSI